jgi:glycosyltransferase involved in cell wall biosynthesis
MKLSFVIPAYNEEKNITDCILSIKSEIQKHGFLFKDGVEIVVVNNNSRDKTREIAESFPGVVVVNEKRKGIVWARQCGMDNSIGELIANVDADVILPEGWLKKVESEFAKNKNLVALSGPYIL